MDLPPLDSSLFLDPHFHPDAFLTARRHILPDDLRSDLRSYLNQRREDLIKTINDDYQDFITLSRDVTGVDAVVKNLDESLVGAYQKLSKASDPLTSLNTQIQDKLSQRAKLREYKSALRLLTSIEESLLNVESLLLITHPLPSQQQNPSISKFSSYSTASDQQQRKISSLQRSKHATKKIDRIASEYNHLLYLANKGKHMKLVQVFQPRIDRISTALQQDLNNLFSSRLLTSQQEDSKQEQSYELLLECLRTYISLNKQSEAEKVFRDSIVRPWVVQNIISTSLSKPLPFNPDEKEISTFKQLQFTSEHQHFQSNPLALLYNRILYFIHVQCSDVLNLTGTYNAKTNDAEKNVKNEDSNDISGTRALENGGSDDIHFIANVIWEQVSNRLMTEIGQPLFSVGDPDQFYIYYTISANFVNRIEELCFSQSQNQLDVLHNHPSFQSFNKKWQLPLYYKLRLNEIVKDLEINLGQPLIKSKFNSNNNNNNNNGNDIKFLLLYTQATYSALLKCWSNNVYLDDLRALFWKLSLQILSRYQTTIKQNLSLYISIPSQQNQPITHSRSESSARSRPDQALPTAPTTTKNRSLAENEGERDEAQDENLLSHLSSVVSDLVMFEQVALEFFNTVVEPRLEPMSTTKKEDNGNEENEEDEDCSPEAVWSELVSFTDSLIPEMESQIVQINVRRCSEPLRLVRSVATQVRNNPNATMKGEPSYFVPGILKSLKIFLFESESGLLVKNEEIKKRWAKAVVEEILLKYTSVIIAMKKSDDSLRRLKKGRGGPGDGISSSSASSSGSGGGFSLFGRAFSSSSQQQQQQQQSLASQPQSSPHDDDQDERVKTQMLRDVDFLVQDATQSFGIVIENNSQTLDNLRKIISGSSMSNSL